MPRQGGVDPPELHPALESLQAWLGTWRGSGAGSYPGIDDFGYEEEAKFWHTGRPFLAYSQRTWNTDSGGPMHSEMGFFRPQRDGTVEVVIAHAFGIVEVTEGTVTHGVIDVASTGLTSSSSAKTVDAVARRFTLDGDVLRYEVQMAFGGHELQGHLRAELHRSR